jgi:2-polyprenyl-6-methoxyphenol hydroxylase-like FAD-dependent oxidoreductase
MWTNAMRALRELGIAERVEASGVRIERTEYRTSRGRLLGAWPLQGLATEHGVPDVGISRAELHHTLAEAVPDGVVRTGAECVGFEQEGGGVRALLASGESETGTVLVGADGIQSVIRGQLLGSAPPDYAGYTQIQSLVEPQGDVLKPGLEQVIFGPGARAILHSVGGGRLFWAAAIYRPEGLPAAGGEIKQELVARYRGWAGPIGAAIEATPEERIFGFDIYDRTPVDRWGTGLVTLLGDAAHPLTTNLSQGGCLALEDAVALVRCLGEDADTEQALRSYERARIERTSPIVKRSRLAARLGRFRNPVTCTMRNAVLRVALGRAGLKEHREFVAAEI